jgi:dienelactone hydrolase
MIRILRRLILLSVLVVGLTSALAQPPSAPPSQAPKIENFQLNGEHWTCTSDGKPFSGVLLKPEGKGPFPGIVLSHGLGGNAQGIALNKGREMVKWGFACIATDYTHAGKGADGRASAREALAGVDFSQAGARPENIRRALACLEILRQQKEVDPRRIAAYGHSMGAFVTIALAAAASDKLAAAAITSGGVIAPEYRAASAPTTNLAAQVRVPFLILQGAQDKTVPPASSEVFKHVLDRNNVPNQRRVFDGVGHNVPTEQADEVNRLMREWFTKYGLLPPKTEGSASSGEEAGWRKAKAKSTEETTSQWVLPVIRAPRLQHHTFDSAAAKTKVSYFIYTPEIYDAETQRRLPVLYWLHGSGGGLSGMPQLVTRFDAAIRAGKTPPMLVVFVNGLTDGMWCDWKNGKGPLETIIMKELLPQVDATFRTIATREGRLIEGFSMGGYGSARLGFKHPGVFGAVSILAGGPLQLDFREAPRAGPRGRDRILQTVFGGDLEYFKAQSPWTNWEFYRAVFGAGAAAAPLAKPTPAHQEAPTPSVQQQPHSPSNSAPASLAPRIEN